MTYRESRAEQNDALARSLSICVAHGDLRVQSDFAGALRAAGYQIIECSDAPSVIVALRDRRFDLVLFGFAMPGLGGVDGCRRVRRLAQQSGIVVLAQRGAEELCALDALEAGADDCLTIPCEPGDLLVRIRSVLHRLRPSSCAKSLRVGDCEIDLQRRVLRVGSRCVHLTRREFDLLVLMMQRAGTPLAHSHLLRAVWGPEYGNELEYLRVYVRLLRKKIEPDPTHPSYIRTEPGIGYYFEDPTRRSHPG